MTHQDSKRRRSENGTQESPKLVNKLLRRRNGSWRLNWSAANGTFRIGETCQNKTLRPKVINWLALPILTYFWILSPKNLCGLHGLAEILRRIPWAQRAAVSASASYSSLICSPRRLMIFFYSTAALGHLPSIRKKIKNKSLTTQHTHTQSPSPASQNNARSACAKSGSSKCTFAPASNESFSREKISKLAAYL